ncbi:hypothetical protein D3C77_522290 [compost metagenome]
MRNQRRLLHEVTRQQAAGITHLAPVVGLLLGVADGVVAQALDALGVRRERDHQHEHSDAHGFLNGSFHDSLLLKRVVRRNTS